jgi:nematocidal protein AidA
MASTDKFIDILTVVDGKSLWQDYKSRPGTLQNPTPLGYSASKYIYMLVRRSEANNGAEAQPELNVAVKTGDTVRFRSISLTGNTSYGTLIYRFDFYSANAGQSLILTPTPNIQTKNVPTLNIGGDGKPDFGSQSYQDFFFSTLAEKEGQVTYELCIMLTDNQGNKLGYFTWDPYLTITKG